MVMTVSGYSMFLLVWIQHEFISGTTSNAITPLGALSNQS